MISSTYERRPECRTGFEVSALSQGPVGLRKAGEVLFTVIEVLVKDRRKEMSEGLKKEVKEVETKV